VGLVQAEARERKEGSLKEVALLTMELEELRGADFESKYERAKEQVRCPCHDFFESETGK
jgi:hypothetical protein